MARDHLKASPLTPTELDLIITEIGLLRASMRGTLWGKDRPGRPIPPAMLRYASTLAKLGEIEGRLLKLKGPEVENREQASLHEIWKAVVAVYPELNTPDALKKISAEIERRMLA